VREQDTKIKSYTGARKDILEMISDAPKNVLDLGCSNGSLGAAIKQKFPGSIVIGVEYDLKFADEAKDRIDSVFHGDLNKFDVNGIPGKFDLIIFADILEHLTNPENVLRDVVSKKAADGGSVIISVPNVQHVTVFGNLIMGQWPERGRGIFDKTHLRWFTLSKLRKMIQSVDCEMVKTHRNYRFFDRTGMVVNKVAKIFCFPPVRNFFAYQYVVLARYQESPGRSR